MKANWLFRFIIIIFLLKSFNLAAQPKWTFEPFGKEKKPKEYEDKLLASEKTASKKFTFFRRFIQNNVTHYNYYFNANNKVNSVVEQAKISQQEDFSKLLSFYPYSLDNTSGQAQDLDSVIYKCTAGILVHDLRTDWVDNLYLLIGKAYFFRKEFDSAALSFQFINNNLFPRKKKDDGERVIGENKQTTVGLSIADKEKRNFYQKITQLPPSRNDALIWLTRTYIEQDKMGEAAGMISILQFDPNLPKRLKDDLNEVTAYWFYKQQLYDSAALYLEHSLSNIKDKAEKARQYYLLAQLYELSGNFTKASSSYVLAAKKTPDALTDIYAHLNNAKMQREKGNLKELDKSISTLVDMAKKDKYESYRDIIYHSAGILSMNKPDTAQAVAFFKKSLSKNESNINYKNKSHLELGKIDYFNRQYKSAADHYDSLDLFTMDPEVDTAEVAVRKENLRKIADQLDIIQKEDSLQMIAAMTPAERDEVLKKIAKKLKKEMGFTAADAASDVNNLPTSSFANDKQNNGADLFDNNAKGEWYFYNATLKSRGFNDFKSKWGKRENVDNWRRLSAMSAANFNSNKDPLDNSAPSSSDSSSGKPVPYSYDALLLDIPLTPEQQSASNQNIANALLELAHIFELELQDFDQAINTYEIYLQRFPDSLADGQIYLGLYHCYNKIGQYAKAEQYKKLLEKEFPDAASTKKISDPYASIPGKNNPPAETMYQTIYDLMIEGKYDEAIKLKLEAEEKFGENFWTPQLSYIGAIYNVKCGSDSEAIVMLNGIVDNYPDSPLREKAATLIEVINHRWEIEQYLDCLDIVRAEEDEKIIIPDDRDIQINKAPVKTAIEPKLKTIAKVNVMNEAGVQLPASYISGPFKWQPGKTHKVLMVLDRVDGVYVTEARNAFVRFNKQFKMDSVNIVKDAIDANKSMLIFGDFDNADEALNYLENIKKSAAKEVSWLQSNKYFFWLMTQDNINALKAGGKAEEYKKLLDQFYPSKF